MFYPLVPGIKLCCLYRNSYFSPCGKRLDKCAFWEKRKHFKTHKYFASGSFPLIFVLTPFSDTPQHFKPRRRPTATIPKVFSFSPQIFAMIVWLQIWKTTLLVKWQIIEQAHSKGLNNDASSRAHKGSNNCFFPEKGHESQPTFFLKNTFHNKK